MWSMGRRRQQRAPERSEAVWRSLALDVLGRTGDVAQAVAELEDRGASREQAEQLVADHLLRIVAEQRDTETLRATQAAALRYCYRLALEQGRVADAIAAQRELAALQGTRAVLRVEVTRGVERLLEAVSGTMSPEAYRELLESLAVVAGVMPPRAGDPSAAAHLLESSLVPTEEVEEGA